jgi:hypothetical protein
MPVTLLLAAALLATPGYGAIDAPRDTDPMALARLFCVARIEGDMRPLEPFFAPKLQALVAGAADVPWQARPDRPDTCTPQLLNNAPDTIGVLVQLTYGAGSQTWTDTLNFERTPDSWWLNNVFYDGGGNLRFRLFETRG